jgi:hypothetical protein
VTESDWDRCTDPRAMLEFLRGKASDRTLRLFAVACVRRVWRLLDDDRSRSAAGVAERFADGLATEQDLQYAWFAATEPIGGARHFHAAWAAREVVHPYWKGHPRVPKAAIIASCAAFAPSEGAGEGPGPPGVAAESLTEGTAQADLLRDVFGNPFRPVVSLDLAWLAWHGGAAGKLAGVVYEERELPSGHLDAGRLAVLADMLEEAGCADPDLLRHLRGPGPHVRGCWVVDLLLGKG